VESWSVGGVPPVARSADGGSLVVEAAVIVPIAMLVIMFAVQACLWAHAATLVQNAANTGEESATALGGSPAKGEIAARAALMATGSKVVVNPSVQAQDLAGGMVEIRVSGSAETIVPWLRLPISATRIGLSQEFRESG